MNEDVRKFLSDAGRKGGKAVSPKAAHERAKKANAVRWGKKKKEKVCAR